MLPKSTKIKSAPIPCVTVDEFAVHANLSVIPDSERELIAAYISAAEDIVSREIKRPLGVCDVDFYFTGATAHNMEIAFTPLVSITSVTVNGQSADFTIDMSAAFPRVKLLMPAAADAEIVISAQVGWEKVPQALRVAVMMLAAGFFEHRMDQSEQSLSDVAGFKRLIASYKQEFAY